MKNKEVLKNPIFSKYNLAALTIDQILEMAVEIGASDVHITANKPLAFRFKKEILKTNIIMRSDIVKLSIDTLTSSASGAGFMKLYKPEEIDGSYKMWLGAGKNKSEFFFRYNISLSINDPHITIRKLINEIPTFEELSITEEKGLPFVKEVLKKQNGIYLVVGETGSGKTTTLVSIIDKFLKNNSVKIITLEAPIEFYYKPNNYPLSLIEQKEVRQDTSTFLTGLRAAMRQDPDIILVGEIRDRETAIAALQASQSGHVVLATLHANGPIDAKDRLSNMLEGQNGFENSLRGAMWQNLYRDKITGEVEVERTWEIFNNN
jgi:twitching motility protein PilT